MDRRSSVYIDVGMRGRLGDYAGGFERESRTVLSSIAAELGLDARHEISVLLCDNPSMQRLNRRWRGRDAPTNVLSFPLQEIAPGRPPAAGPLGDVVVSLPYVRREARQLRRAPREHFAHMLIHGLLHLLGYDHETEPQARRMERLERRLLARLEGREE